MYQLQKGSASLLAMKKATVMIHIALASAVFLFDSSAGSVDFFDILDRETAEFLQGGKKLLHRSNSAAAISSPRNNKYLGASMQIIRGKN